LQSKVKQSTVAKAFGLSSGAVSLLANCLKTPTPGRRAHYRQIAAEWYRLGDTAFREAYYSDDLHTRMMRIKYDVATAIDVRPRGPNRNADSESFAARRAFHLYNEYWRIDWVGDGWRFANCQPNGEPMPDDVIGYRGHEAYDPDNTSPYRTSAEALAGINKMF
jgi:hypothetical protein